MSVISLNYSKDKAVENLRNVTELLQFTLLGICLASDEMAVPISSVEKIHLSLTSCILDLTDFGKEFIKDRKNVKRLDSTVIKLLSSGVSMAYNVAEHYYKTLNNHNWSRTKKWETPYPYAAQIRNMYSHAFFWSFRRGWIKDYENNGGLFPIKYSGLKIEKGWNGRKAIIADVSPCGDLIALVEDIITDISGS